MIAGFPVLVPVPGLLFIAAGFWYRYRAAQTDPRGALGKRMAEAGRKTGNLSLAMGGLLLVIAVLLGLALRGLQ